MENRVLEEVGIALKNSVNATAQQEKLCSRICENRESASLDHARLQPNTIQLIFGFIQIHQGDAVRYNISSE